MTQKSIITCLLIGSIFFSSCGTNKKLATANSEIQQLQASNSQLKTANSEMESKQKNLQSQVDKLTAANKTVNEEYSQYRSRCEVTKQKLEWYQASLEEDLNTVMEIQKRIEDAVADFEDKGVEVYQKDRVIYVNMEDNLLYKSGSAELGADGKKALGALASALNNYPKLRVIVVGNTDDKKFKSSNTDNLSLSTERANGVVRVLRDSYHVDPTRLISAGQGKYNPVADNATADGRAKNRRTEIILRPDMMKLWESAEGK